MRSTREYSIYAIYAMYVCIHVVKFIFVLSTPTPCHKVPVAPEVVFNLAIPIDHLRSVLSERISPLPPRFRGTVTRGPMRVM